MNFDTRALLWKIICGESGKLESLLELLEQRFRQEATIDPFSIPEGYARHYRKEIEKDWKWRHLKLQVLHQQRDRQMVKCFQQWGREIAFLKSPWLVALALNPTGADTVILVGPLVESSLESAQLVEKTHRMGQERNVEVYRPITRGTIEEKNSRVARSKRHLVSTILDGRTATA